MDKQCKQILNFLPMNLQNPADLFAQTNFCASKPSANVAKNKMFTITCWVTVFVNGISQH